MGSFSLIGRIREQWSSRAEENPVRSLALEASQAAGEEREHSQFQVLMSHIFSRLFEGDMISLEGDTQTRIIQTVVVTAIPGLMWDLARIASYHQPRPKLFWAQASDHYFSIVYSFVVMGTVAIFEWDQLFPDLLDCFVLTPLPITARTLFTARVTALALLLGVFLFATNVLGSIFLCLWYWSMAKSAEVYSPGYLGHVGPHLAAVLLSGIFAVGLVVALQGVLICMLGEPLFRRISASLQSILIAVFLLVLFLFPLLSHYLPALLESGSPVVRWFPPFWFLGMHERLLYGPAVEPIFHVLARSGYWATVLTAGMAAITYPLAYRRKIRRTIEGAAARKGRGSFATAGVNTLLHNTVLRTPAKRAIYHFISQTLLRIERHRLYLAMYAGLGLSLILSIPIGLRLAHHHVALVLSPYGLRSAIPVIAFWTISGLRTALLSPIDPRGSWIFRLIDGKPGLDQLAGTRTWVFMRTAGLTAVAILALRVLAPNELRSFDAIATQCVVGFGLCLLLVDAFFVNVMVVPFNERRSSSKSSLAFILVGYIALFPPLVWNTVDAEPWIKASRMHMAFIIIVIAALHPTLHAILRRKFNDQVRLPDGEEEDWPPKLGLN
jgi:hypothetical protein